MRLRGWFAHCQLAFQFMFCSVTSMYFQFSLRDSGVIINDGRPVKKIEGKWCIIN